MFIFLELNKDDTSEKADTVPQVHDNVSEAGKT